LRLPALAWLSHYDRGLLRADVVAGITLAAYLLPAGIGDAALAGLPPQAGLYACMLGGLVFWLFCSSRVTAITVTSAISLLIGATLGDISGGDPQRHAALAACTAAMVAGIALVAALLRAGAVVHFISETVLVGFKAGVAFHLASTQLPKLFGFKGTHGDFWERMGWFLSHAGETHTLSLAVGLAALVVLLAGKKLLPARPVALFVVVGGIVGAALLDLAGQGVKLLGDVPVGFPQLGLPDVQLSDLNTLLPLAMACFLLAAVETSAIGRMFARKHGYRLDADKEFLSLAAANGLAGLGQGFPVSGGMSQSLVNESAGARTPLSGLVAAGIVLLVILFLSGLLRNLPEPVLAAIILVAVTGLVKVDAIREIARFSRTEILIATAAFVGVLFSGLLRGVLIGAVISILMLLRRGARPPVAELGRIPGTDFFADLARHPENERTPGVFVFRVNSSILYFNAEFIRDRFFELLGARTDDVRLVILDLATTPMVDLAGVELLRELGAELRERGIDARSADARGPVRDALRRAGAELGDSRVGVAEEIARWQAGSSAGEPA
jgi:SulP family sulfate permease